MSRYAISGMWGDDLIPNPMPKPSGMWGDELIPNPMPKGPSMWGDQLMYDRGLGAAGGKFPLNRGLLIFGAGLLGLALYLKYKK